MSVRNNPFSVFLLWMSRIVFVFFLAFFGWQGCVNILFFFGYEKILSPLGIYDREILYNELLREKGRVAGQEDISLILSSPPPGKNQDIAELYGDILFVQSGSMTDIIASYESGIAVSSRDRIHEKIRLLLAPPASPPRESVNTGSGQSRTFSGSISSSGYSTDIEQARKRIEESARNQSALVDIFAPDDVSKVIQDTVQFLDTSTEQKDW